MSRHRFPANVVCVFMNMGKNAGGTFEIGL
jgi:hypothetical protein